MDSLRRACSWSRSSPAAPPLLAAASRSRVRRSCSASIRSTSSTSKASPRRAFSCSAWISSRSTHRRAIWSVIERTPVLIPFASACTNRATSAVTATLSASVSFSPAASRLTAILAAVRAASSSGGTTPPSDDSAAPLLPRPARANSSAAEARSSALTSSISSRASARSSSLNDCLTNDAPGGRISASAASSSTIRFPSTTVAPSSAAAAARSSALVCSNSVFMPRLLRRDVLVLAPPSSPPSPLTTALHSSLSVLSFICTFNARRRSRSAAFFASRSAWRCRFSSSLACSRAASLAAKTTALPPALRSISSAIAKADARSSALRASSSSFSCAVRGVLSNAAARGGGRATKWRRTRAGVEARGPSDEGGASGSTSSVAATTTRPCVSDTRGVPLLRAPTERAISLGLESTRGGDVAAAMTSFSDGFRGTSFLPASPAASARSSPLAASSSDFGRCAREEPPPVDRRA
mmetsp:Transcript_12130/g.38902  ORF Transcript_12130/g.38902 Transcript_12130/m.38902 type:complete len:468 (+) Transcript_12130:1428-2831(+)|eukprot:scaffold2795_cov106-Isochrysis_galbana.AAC.8